ncbi:MAG: sensor domain-containing diguanylate cyclase [Elusimicrobia bacterium]|nr:sensor domain-containing diguanylate cyclase [Elusimicrobiota bacterium]
MERIIYFLPLLVFIIGYKFGIILSRLAAILSIIFTVFFHPSPLSTISVILTLCLVELVIEKFYKQLASSRRNFNKELSNLTGKLALVKGESGKTKLELLRNEKTIKNILHIYELSKNIAAYVDLEKMFGLIAKSLDEQFNIKDVNLKIFEGNKNFQKGLPVRIDENIKTQTISNGIIHVPLFIGEQSLGIISTKIPPLYEKDEEFFDEIAAFVEELILAVQRAILYSKVEAMSRTDGLTGLYRRGYFNERLKEEEFRAKRWNGRFSILMMDIDHFKKVNDTYGHQAGDLVLKTVTGILKNSIYETDFAARYGGEEFVVIFPQTDPAGIKIKAEKIREKIEETEILAGLEKLKVTSSFGIAHYPKDALTANEVLHKADMSLYKSKETGRNKVTEFEE